MRSIGFPELLVILGGVVLASGHQREELAACPPQLRYRQPGRPSLVSISHLAVLDCNLRRALLLSLLSLRGNGRFLLDRRVCSLGLFALAFQAQFDEVLPKLAVVHGFSLSRNQESGSSSGGVP